MSQFASPDYLSGTPWPDSAGRYALIFLTPLWNQMRKQNFQALIMLGFFHKPHDMQMGVKQMAAHANLKHEKERYIGEVAWPDTI